MFTTEAAELRRIIDEVGSLCAGIDPVALDPAEVGRLVDTCTVIRRLADGALTRLASAYDRSGAWKHTGANSAADDLARRCGSAPSSEKRRVATSADLAARPVLDDAVRAGRVSSEQAATIASSASGPETEADLIDAARTESHRSFLDKAASARAAGDRNAEARRRRIHRRRSLRTWTDPDGTGHLHVKDLPERIAELAAALRPGLDDAFASARRQGRREPLEAYAADALHASVCGDDAPTPRRRSGQAVRPDRKVIATVELAALHRGGLDGDETCEIAGVGPVSVTAARALLGDAQLAIVIRDSVDIRSVTHLGRQVTAHQRTALEARGYRCEIVGCGATRHLEIDHVEPWALTRHTTVDELAWLCRQHHDGKTRTGQSLVGPPGARSLSPPGTPRGWHPPDVANAALGDGTTHQTDLFAGVSS